MHKFESSGEKTVHSLHTAKVHRSRNATPEIANPNQDDVFLPKHAPIHIDPKTHEHFQVNKDGSIVSEENIGNTTSPQKRSSSPQFTDSTPTSKGNMMTTPVIGKAIHGGKQLSDTYTIPDKQSQPLNMQFPDDPCP
jgi:hypothetical protein